MKQKQSFKNKKAIAQALISDRAKTSLYLSKSIYEASKLKLKKEHPNQTISNLVEVILEGYIKDEIQ